VRNEEHITSSPKRRREEKRHANAMPLNITAPIPYKKAGDTEKQFPLFAPLARARKREREREKINQTTGYKRHDSALPREEKVKGAAKSSFSFVRQNA